MLKNEMLAPRVLVIIPAYNEGPNLWSVIHGVRTAVPTADVLVVDDGSTDETPAIARSAGVQVVSHPFNLGYGAALQTGFKYAVAGPYEFIVQLDGDGQHEPQDVRSILSALCTGEVDVVIGSRYLGSAPAWTGRLRRWGSQTLAQLTSWIVGQPITDPTSGFQGCTRQVAAFYARDHFPVDFPDADVIIMLHRAGFRTCEIPVTMYSRPQGRSMHGGFRWLYYVYKMLLAILLTLVRDDPIHSREEG